MSIFCNRINFFSDSKYKILLSLGITFLIGRQYYYNFCFRKTFDRLDELFPRKLEWEQDLEIYSVALPKFYTSYKKKKCVLFISGYRDTPYVWENITKYFIQNNIDFYAPRTFGKGRSFFQNAEPNDWVITYLEAITILQEQYEEIDIIAFSTGCVIALYLTQYKFKCKISNLILCAPFLIRAPSPLLYWVFDSPISWIINPIMNWVCPLRYKVATKYTYPRDINFDEHGRTDYYELAGYFELETKLMEFKKFRPKNILVDNVVIFYPNDDQIIGDIQEQRNILEKIWGNPIPIITIPNYGDISLPRKCGHVMFKEHPRIIRNIFDNLTQFIM